MSQHVRRNMRVGLLLILTLFCFGFYEGSASASSSYATINKKVKFEEAMYMFSLQTNHSVRVKLDGKVILATFPSATVQTKQKPIQLTAGIHQLTVEYPRGKSLKEIGFDFWKITKLPTQVGKTVHYNWGQNSLAPGLPTDQFTVTFDQSGSYASGDYFIQAMADDGVRVDVDGKRVIDRFSSYNGKVDRALWLNVSGGEHKVQTDYLEATAGAGIFSDVVPFNSWLAYYYPTKSISGMPTGAKIVAPSGSLQGLTESFSTTSPVPGVGPTQFAARYTTAKRMKAGSYILRAKADDGIKVYVDGQLVIDRWTDSALREDAIKLQISDRSNVASSEKEVHWIEVQYYNAAGVGSVDVSVESFDTALTDTWLGEVYPTKNLTGTPYILGGNHALAKVTNLNYQLGTGRLHPLVSDNNFSARFTKKVTLEAGTYMFAANADDGYRVYLDQQLVIDKWPNTSFAETREALFVPAGEHKVTVEYYDDVAGAFLTFDMKKLSSKEIFYQHTKDVQYNWGLSGPTGLPVDGFEAIFDHSGTYAAGDYFLQTLADDGVKVEADNQVLINRWSDYTGKADRAVWTGVTAGYHNVMTSYYDNILGAAVYSNIVPFNSWLAYYYPNTTLSGLPAATKVVTPTDDNFQSLDEDFQSGSPATGVGSDKFSVKYTTAKRIPAGTYVFRAGADDGVRVYIDGKLVIDRWTDSGYREDLTRFTVENQTNVQPGQENIHWIEVEYYDNVATGKVHFSIEPIVGPVYLTTHYNYSIQQMIDLQVSKASPQTDLHQKYVRSDALTLNSKGQWVIAGGPWIIRNGPGQNYSQVGSMNPGVVVSIVNTIQVPGDLPWYQITGWMNAMPNDVAYYVNPTNFPKGSAEYFQFLKLSESTGLNTSEVDIKVLNGKGILSGKASSFIEAGKRLGINEVYLLSHALLETGNGTSQLANGILVSKVDGVDVPPMVVYNMYGINAKDACANQCGSEYAYKMGWTTPELAIVGGAEFIASKYIKVGQDTLYKMRWNPAAPATHQYATDIGWATKQVRRMKDIYDMLSSYSLVYDEPVFH